MAMFERGWLWRSARRADWRGAGMCDVSRRISAREAEPRESRAAGFSRGSSGCLEPTILRAEARTLSGGAAGGGGAMTSVGAADGFLVFFAMTKRLVTVAAWRNRETRWRQSFAEIVRW